MQTTTPTLDYTNSDVLWEAFHDADSGVTGQLYMAVRTTGIYCRPGCPARTPKRENVRFFATPTSAERSGFRACKRCKPQFVTCDPRLVMVEDACRWIEEHADEDVSLRGLAVALAVGPQTLQRAFREVLGLSPRAYTRERRLSHLRDDLRGGTDVAQAIYGAGFGSSSRVYESAHRDLGMTPANYKRGANGLTIQIAIGRSQFGIVGVGRTARGICAVRLGNDPDQVLADIRAEFPMASISLCPEDPDLGAIVASIVDGTAINDLALDIRGTAFQHKVWDALRRIPRGESRTYQEIAASIGAPSAFRAVANACGANPVALAIPCHRAVRTDGKAGGYRWGSERKAAILELERIDPVRELPCMPSESSPVSA